jgi:hypothetical protein
VRRVSLPNSQSTRTLPELSRDMTLINAPTAPAQKQKIPIPTPSAFPATVIQPASASGTIGTIPSSIPPT